MDWNKYLTQSKNYSTRPLLREALSYIKNKKIALDLGAGSLNDTRFLINEGFKVVVVDYNQKIAELVKELPQSSFELNITPFETYDFPFNTFDLVNAQYSLPFIKPIVFNKVFASVKESLLHEGVFTGQLFGNEDEWSSNPNLTFHTRKQVDTFFIGNDWNVHKINEEKTVRKTADGVEKFWHIFHVIASRIRNKGS